MTRLKNFAAGMASLLVVGGAGFVVYDQIAGVVSSERAPVTQNVGAPIAITEYSEGSDELFIRSDGATRMLERNLEELTAQQAAERALASEVLQLPDGAEFGDPDAFTEITDQLDELRDPDSQLEPGEDDAGLPDTFIYEDGFFKSVMAIDWRCAWLSEGVRQVNAGDLDGAATTVDLIHSLKSSEFAVYFPNYDAFLSRSVDPLLHGNTRPSLEYLSRCVGSTRVD